MKVILSLSVQQANMLASALMIARQSTQAKARGAGLHIMARNALELNDIRYAELQRMLDTCPVSTAA